jgi:Cu2+-exporting ATPase
MTAITAPAISSTTAADAAAECFHCGLPVPARTGYQVNIDGAARNMCCAGCAAVAETIVASGLADYYRHRSAPSTKPDEVAPDFLRNLQHFDLDTAQQTFVRLDETGISRAELLLEGITCPACVWLAEQTLKRLDGVTEVYVNYATERAQLAWDGQRVKLSAILRAIAEVGLSAHPFDAALRSALRAQERRKRLFELAVAGLGMMQVMMYVVPGYLSAPGEIDPAFETVMRWASLVLTLPVVLFSSRSFFSGAWRDLAHRSVGMDVPIALAIAVAFGASVRATLAGHGETYFDSVTMFVFLLLGARFLEVESRARAAAAIERLSRPLPANASRLGAYPLSRATENVSAATLVPGDVVLVESGAIIPADGAIVEGASEVDEALLSGESAPLARSVSDSVIGGSVNIGSPLVVRVTRASTDSVLSHIARLADRALGEKPRLVELTARIASIFSAAVVLLAALTALIWLPVAGDAWLRHAIAVLVVTCPCALALATPAALTAATGRLCGLGLLATRGHAVETLARATDMVFDKTGTLSSNTLRVSTILPIGKVTRDEALALAAALEEGSSHPLARAIVAAALASPDAKRFVARNGVHGTGQGVEADIEGERMRIGSAAFVAELAGTALAAMPAAQTSNSCVFLGKKGQWLARLEIADTLRSDARESIAALRASGLRIHILSGDQPGAVEAAAHALGIAENVVAQATPARKLEYVESLQREGRIVVMVGDGINDAPVLARAQLSIAMSSGAGLARAHADMVLLSPHLRVLAQGVLLARAARRIIRQNLAWAIGYNAVAAPLAMLGWVAPWLAALGMSASSLLVVANAARLNRRNTRG